MSFLVPRQDDLSPELFPVAQELAQLSTEYDLHAGKATKARMKIIGKVSEAKRQFNQRSADHRYLQSGLDGYGWSDSIQSQNATAYRLYVELKGNVNDIFQKLADEASPRLLYQLTQADEESTVVYDAAQYLKKNGKCPTITDVKGHLGGYKSSKFESKPGSGSKPKPEHNPYVAPKQEHPSPQPERPPMRTVSDPDPRDGAIDTTAQTVENTSQEGVNSASTETTEDMATALEFRKDVVSTTKDLDGVAAPSPLKEAYMIVQNYVQPNRNNLTDEDKRYLSTIVGFIDKWCHIN
jgi:hypothetical protein